MSASSAGSAGARELALITSITATPTPSSALFSSTQQRMYPSTISHKNLRATCGAVVARIASASGLKIATVTSSVTAMAVPPWICGSRSPSTRDVMPSTSPLPIHPIGCQSSPHHPRAIVSRRAMEGEQWRGAPSERGSV
jgi:hypothetical protein